MHLISLSIKRFGCSLFCKKICSIMRTHFLDGLNIIFAATNRILQILDQSKYLCSLPLIRIDSHKILYSWTLPMKFTFNFVVIQENGEWYTLILILHVQFFFVIKLLDWLTLPNLICIALLMLHINFFFPSWIKQHFIRKCLFYARYEIIAAWLSVSDSVWSIDMPRPINAADMCTFANVSNIRVN